MADISDAHTALPTLRGRRAIVTGGTTGIGRAIAVLLASEGVRVHVCGRTKSHLKDALKRINEVGEGEGTPIDLGEPENVHRYFAEATRWLGGLDIAVINAAIPANALGDTSEKALRIFADNPRGLLNTTDELVGALGNIGAYKRSGDGDRALMLRFFDGGDAMMDRVGGGTLYAESAAPGRQQEWLAGIRVALESLRDALHEQAENSRAGDSLLSSARRAGVTRGRCG